MAEVKWIKIATQIFDNRKIRQIECMPDGDTIIVIWFKLLCLAGIVNDKGQVYITQEVPYTEQTLANQFNRPLTTIQFALQMLEKFGMIEVIDDILHISNWEKYQNVDGMEKVREQTRLRVAKHREEKKECNVTVTLRNATDKEEEKEKEKKEYIVEFFESVWRLYPRKEGRSAIKMAKMKELYKIGYDKVAYAIQKYADEVNGRDKQYILMGSTFFNGRYKDYLPDDETVTSEKAQPEEDELEGYQ